MMGAKGVLLRRKIVKPLIEDVPISQSCIRERDAGNFLAPRDVSPGTVVICALVKGITHHSGVWLGNGMIAELDGNGNYRAVRLKRFISGDEGEPWRTGSFAYAACNVYGKPLGAKKLRRAPANFSGKRPSTTWTRTIAIAFRRRATTTGTRKKFFGSWKLFLSESSLRVFVLFTKKKKSFGVRSNRRRNVLHKLQNKDASHCRR